MSSRILAVSSTARAAWRSRAAMFSAISPISLRGLRQLVARLLQLVAQLVGDAVVRGDLILAILDLRAQLLDAIAQRRGLGAHALAVGDLALVVRGRLLELGAQLLDLGVGLARIELEPEVDHDLVLRPPRADARRAARRTIGPPRPNMLGSSPPGAAGPAPPPGIPGGPPYGQVRRAARQAAMPGRPPSGSPALRAGRRRAPPAPGAPPPGIPGGPPYGRSGAPAPGIAGRAACRSPDGWRAGGACRSAL